MMKEAAKTKNKKETVEKAVVVKMVKTDKKIEMEKPMNRVMDDKTQVSIEVGGEKMMERTPKKEEKKEEKTGMVKEGKKEEKKEEKKEDAKGKEPKQEEKKEAKKEGQNDEKKDEKVSLKEEKKEEKKEDNIEGKKSEKVIAHKEEKVGMIKEENKEERKDDKKDDRKEEVKDSKKEEKKSEKVVEKKEDNRGTSKEAKKEEMTVVKEEKIEGKKEDKSDAKKEERKEEKKEERKDEKIGVRKEGRKDEKKDKMDRKEYEKEEKTCVMTIEKKEGNKEVKKGEKKEEKDDKIVMKEDRKEKDKKDEQEEKKDVKNDTRREEVKDEKSKMIQAEKKEGKEEEDDKWDRTKKQPGHIDTERKHKPKMTSGSKSDTIKTDKEMVDSPEVRNTPRGTSRRMDILKPTMTSTEAWRIKEREGMIPSKEKEKEELPAIDPKEENLLLELPFYHGLIPKEDLHEMLLMPGDFVLRVGEASELWAGPPSDDTVVVVLSLVVGKGKEDKKDLESNHDGVMRHLAIKRSKAGRYKLDSKDSLDFEGVRELSDHYRKNKGVVVTKSGEMEFKLLNPIGLQKWEYLHKNVRKSQMLGKGAFGEVHAGTLKKKGGLIVDVAVKTIRGEKATRDQLRSLLAEARIMRNMKHKNVVRLYGVVMEKLPLLVILELVNGGSLLAYLKSTRPNKLSEADKLSLCLGAGRGAEHIHKLNCLHRDIAARNYLITVEKVVKISDFGMSVVGSRFQSKDGKNLPVRWLAPEVLDSLLFSRPSDVYSFGVVLFEIWNDGSRPWKSFTGDIKQMVLSGKSLTLPSSCPEALRTYTESRIFAVDPAKRPTMTEICDFLVSIGAQDIAEPPRKTVAATIRKKANRSRMLRLSLACSLVVLASCQLRCGQTPVRPNITTGQAIVGGHPSVPFSWPWQVVWCTQGWIGGCSLECGGTLVADKWVVTAGHCVYGSEHSPGKFRVKLGVYKESDSGEPGEQLLSVKNIHLHPNYTTKPDPQWDIALIELESAAAFTEHVQPICLASHDDKVAVDPNWAWATGWGATRESGFISKDLRQVRVPFVNLTQCDSEYPHDINNDVMICAGTKGEDTCQGDSGGPLVVAQGDTWFQYGITSFGRGCAEYLHPGVYSRVSAYCSWISSTTGGAVSCHDPDTY